MSILYRFATAEYSYAEVTGEDEAEFRAKLDALSNSTGEIAQVMQNLAGAAKLANELSPSYTPGPSGQHDHTQVAAEASSRSDGYGRKKQEARAGEGSPPSCDHGRMQFKSSNTGGAQGDGWKAFFCPLPASRKSEQCKPIFLDD